MPEGQSIDPRDERIAELEAEVAAKEEAISKMERLQEIKHQNVDPIKLAGMLQRAQAALLKEDFQVLKAVTDTLVFLQQEMQNKGASIEKLKKILFGATTEKTVSVLGKKSEGQKKKKKAKVKGHGRNGAAAYTGAEQVKVSHPQLTVGQSCAGCLKGKLYPTQPEVLVRITGMAPLNAKVYQCDKLKCNLCGEAFAAPTPEGVGNSKYDESCAAMVAELKYGVGLPFNRIEKLQQGMGIPLPAATQWELVEAAANQCAPVHEELARQAAQCDVLHNDDTPVKILDMTKEQLLAAAEDESNVRTGVQTTGIIAKRSKDIHIALFMSGLQHAGENISDILEKRAQGLKAPIQMSDALAANTSHEWAVILANCLVHARRNFVDVVDNFPDECAYVINVLRGVYKNDADAKANNLSSEERLLLHQKESGPLMDELKVWLDEQFDEKKVEPNSGLGKAISYMTNHWPKLTRFLHEKGAPLDNNICERALKKAILHRKNSLFYKTQNGARVGDIFMSFIHTAELCGKSPFDYLVSILRHHEVAAKSPENWMPWNYQETLKLQRTKPAG